MLPYTILLDFWDAEAEDLMNGSSLSSNANFLRGQRVSFPMYMYIWGRPRQYQASIVISMYMCIEVSMLYDPHVNGLATRVDY